MARYLGRALALLACSALLVGCSTAPATRPSVGPPASGVPGAATATRMVPEAGAPSATTAGATVARPGATASPAATPGAAYATITTGDGRRVRVRLEVAATPESRAVGLSRRQSLPEDAGMLFVFPSDGQAAFWMKDTSIPLSIAFISAEGRILEIQDMDALSEELHRPAQPYRYALEVNRSFFRRSGVTVGDTVEFHLGGDR